MNGPETKRFRLNNVKLGGPTFPPTVFQTLHDLTTPLLTPLEEAPGEWPPAIARWLNTEYAMLVLNFDYEELS